MKNYYKLNDLNCSKYEKTELLFSFMSNNGQSEKSILQSTLFNTDENKLNQMALAIKENISQIQKSIQDLNKNQILQQRNSQQAVARTIIEILQQRSLDLATQFKKSLQTRTKLIKQQDEKKKKNIPIYQQTQITKRQGPLFIKNQEKQTDTQIDMSNVVLQQENFQHNRIDSMKNIEKMIGEVAGIFQRLGNIVQMHDTMIDRIDKQTDESLDNIQKSRKNINEVYQNTMNNRAFMLKIFLILSVFATFYIIFIV